MAVKMIVRDADSVKNGESKTVAIASGTLDVVADDGRTLFSLTLQPDGGLLVTGGVPAKHGGLLLSEKITIEPRDRARVVVRRIVEQ